LTKQKLELAAAGSTARPSADSGTAGDPHRRVTWVSGQLSLHTLVTTRLSECWIHTGDIADALGVAGPPKRTPIGWEVTGTNASLSFVVTDGTANVSFTSGIPGVVGGSSGSTGAGGATTPGGAVVNGPIKVIPPIAPPTPVPAPSPTPPTLVPNPAPPVDVPSASDAQTIARALLDKLGVLASQNWTTAVNENDGVAVSCPAGVPCPTVPTQVSEQMVTFSLVLDGVPVAGVDWSVTIGAHRRVESLNGQWATPAAVGTYALRPTASVFADLQKGTARFGGPVPMMAMAGVDSVGAPAQVISPNPASVPAVTVHITGVALGITRWNAYSPGQSVSDLVPTYRFHAHVDGGTSYDIEVLALEPGAVTFTNPIPKPGPGPIAVEPAPAPLPPDSVVVSP